MEMKLKNISFIEYIAIVGALRTLLHPDRFD